MFEYIKDDPIAISILCFTSVMACFALRPLPSSILLIAMISLIRLLTQVIVPRPWAGWRLLSLWLAVTIGCATSLSISGSSAVTSLRLTLLYSGSFSLLGLLPTIASAHRKWAGFTFPAIWATWWWIVTRLSPIGRLGVWSPLTGDDVYEWMRPFVGDYGIDWVIGGWVEVMTSFTASRMMGEGPNAKQDNRPSQEHSSSRQPIQGNSVWSRLSGIRWSQHQVSLLLFSLVFLSIPSTFSSTLPPRLHGEDRRDVGVACILPPPSNGNETLSFQSFIKATRIVAGQAHIILWPEWAVGFESQTDREEKVEQIRDVANTTGLYIGVPFTEPATKADGSNSGKWRNGIVIVSSEGIIMEYYKRHFIPFVDSLPQVSGRADPPVVNVTLGTVSKPTLQWNMTLSALIGSEFAHPFFGWKTRPTLILGPSRTWQKHASRVMMKMARHRADELGTTVLWCDDGDEGLSGLVGQGQSGVQVGYGTWVKRISIRIPLEEARTAYGYAGEWIVGIWASWLPVIMINFSLGGILQFLWTTKELIKEWIQKFRRPVRLPVRSDSLEV